MGIALHYFKRYEEAYRSYTIGYSISPKGQDDNFLLTKLEILRPHLPSLDALSKVGLEIFPYYLDNENRLLYKQHLLVEEEKKNNNNTISSSPTTYDDLKELILTAMVKEELDQVETKEEIQSLLKVNPVVTYIVIVQIVMVLAHHHPQLQQPDMLSKGILPELIQKVSLLAPLDPLVQMVRVWTL